jgi:hypothetical protein
VLCGDEEIMIFQLNLLEKIRILKKEIKSWAWWHMPAIPALGRLRQNSG